MAQGKSDGWSTMRAWRTGGATLFFGRLWWAAHTRRGLCQADRESVRHPPERCLPLRFWLQRSRWLGSLDALLDTSVFWPKACFHRSLGQAKRRPRDRDTENTFWPKVKVTWTLHCRSKLVKMAFSQTSVFACPVLGRRFACPRLRWKQAFGQKTDVSGGWRTDSRSAWQRPRWNRRSINERWILFSASPFVFKLQRERRQPSWPAVE